MLFELSRNRFLRPRERLYELLALQRASGRRGLELEAQGEGTLDARTIAGYVRRLVERGFLVAARNRRQGAIRITAAGRRRLHYLLVDFAHELASQQERARSMFRTSLLPLALSDVRRVALYPLSETAEVVYSALEPLGLELVAVVDDASQKWGRRFHGIRVESPTTLPRHAVDAVLVATAVFQDRIVRRIKRLRLRGARIHVL